jgi:hypothetical protein
MRKELSTLLLFTITFLLFSCGGNEKPDDIISDDEKSQGTAIESQFKAQNFFNTLPDGNLVMKLIGESQLEYEAGLLNDPQSVSNYALEAAKAINLGIYGSDLSIASSFNQTQESLIFLKCVNILAKQLGVSSAFDEQLFERIDANNQNKDSVIEIVSNAFKRVDEILKNNNRPATAAVILSGCWIEGLYVSCQLAQRPGAESLINTIIAQKESLNNVIFMLEGVELEEASRFILVDLRQLQESFKVAESNAVYDKKTIADITLRISALRNKLTKLV